MIIVAFVCSEIDLAQELLLMIFEFPYHFVRLVVIEDLGQGEINYFERMSDRKNVFAALRN
jgi:hypothetical protein